MAWFWHRKPETPDRDAALHAISKLKRDRLLKPRSEPTPGSANDDYWATQAGLGGG